VNDEEVSYKAAENGIVAFISFLLPSGADVPVVVTFPPNKILKRSKTRSQS
jgi:hypothetical protein